MRRTATRRRPSIASVLVTGSSVVLAGCLPGTVESRDATRTTSTAPSSTSAGSDVAGADEAALREQLRAIPGVRDVELRRVDGFDTGDYLLASLEVASRDEAAAIRMIDAAMAVMWRAAETPDKRARVFVHTDTGTFTVADDGDLDPDIRMRYRDAMTKRYGPWPGRGAPPTP